MKEQPDTDQVLNVDSPATALLGRRCLLRWTLGAGAYLAVKPVIGAAQQLIATQPIRLQNRKLICVFAEGGLRSSDCYYKRAGVETRWAASTGVSLKPGWIVPGPGRSLQAVASKLCVLTGLDMESASHNVATTLAMTGYRQSRSVAGAVLAANNLHTPLGTPANPFSLSFPRTLSANHGAIAPIAGEPLDLSILFSDPNFTGTPSFNQVLRDEINAENAAYAQHVVTDSRFLDWRTLDDQVKGILARNLGGKIYDPAVVAAYTGITAPNPDPALAPLSVDATAAKRFAAAYSAIKNNVARVVSLSVPGFDTHAQNQHNQCARLAALMTKLVQDLTALSGKTLVMLFSEFDRTDLYNGAQGTDHHPIGPVLLAGSGPTGVIPCTGRTRVDVWRSVLDWLGINGEAFFPTSTRLFAP